MKADTTIRDLESEKYQAVLARDLNILRIMTKTLETHLIQGPCFVNRPVDASTEDTQKPQRVPSVRAVATIF